MFMNKPVTKELPPPMKAVLICEGAYINVPVSRPSGVRNGMYGKFTRIICPTVNVAVVGVKMAPRFFLSTTMSDGTWFHQVLVLGVRGNGRFYLPYAAKLYRSLKKRGVITKKHTFREIAGIS